MTWWAQKWRSNSKRRFFTHQHCASLALFKFCWWHHNWLCNTSDDITIDLANRLGKVINDRKKISNLLDINFIHDNIHSLSCKKLWTGHYCKKKNKKNIACDNAGYRFCWFSIFCQEYIIFMKICEIYIYNGFSEPDMSGKTWTRATLSVI